MAQDRSIAEALSTVLQSGLEEVAEKLRRELHVNDDGTISWEIDEADLAATLEMLYGCNAPADVEAWLRTQYSPEELAEKFDSEVNEGDVYYFLKGSREE